MIAVSRLAEPAVLLTNKVSWLAALNAATKAKNSSQIKACQSKYGHAQVKTQLEKMFHEKCAYCESHINAVTTGHIEHFRPKSRFRSQTFEWLNLLLSCPTCNNKSHKGTKFPSVIAGGRLIDPTAEDPALHFEFVFDSLTNLALAKPISDRGKTTAAIFGLNTRKALIKSRSSLLKKLLFIKSLAATDKEAADLIAEAKLIDQPYLAWTNALV